MKNISKKVILPLLIAGMLLASASCDNGEAALNTIVTTRISLEPETSATEAVTTTVNAEPEFFLELPELYNRVFDVYEKLPDSNEYDTPVGIYCFMAPTVGFICDMDVTTRTNFSFTEVFEDTSAENREDMPYTLDTEPMRVSQKYTLSYDDFSMQYELFVENGELYAVVGDDYNDMHYYQFKCRWGVSTQDIDRQYMENTEVQKVDLNSLIDMYTNINAPEQLTNCMRMASLTPVVINRKVTIGDNVVEYKSRIYDAATAIVESYVNDKLDSKLLLTQQGIFDIDDTNKKATCYSSDMQGVMTTILDLQTIVSLNPEDVVINSDTQTFGDVSFAHVNITNNEDFNTDYYFDTDNGTLKYIVSDKKVTEITKLSNEEQLNYDDFKIPDGYEVIYLEA